MAGEERDLHFPGARVGDRPGRHEQDGGIAVAEHFVKDPDAVALDEAIGVW
jgi:hypothetical protein